MREAVTIVNVQQVVRPDRGQGTGHTARAECDLTEQNASRRGMGPTLHATGFSGSSFVSQSRPATSNFIASSAGLVRRTSCDPSRVTNLKIPSRRAFMR